jgi:hypothetical protein
MKKAFLSKGFFYWLESCESYFIVLKLLGKLA